MGKLTKVFTDAFEKADKKINGTLTSDHMEQLNALQLFVDALNTEGVFKAELKSLTRSGSVPTLEIARKSDGEGQTFFIDFGREPFGGGVTIKFSTGLHRQPVGKNATGYSLTDERESAEIFALLAEEVAAKCKKLQLGTSTTNYLAGIKRA